MQPETNVNANFNECIKSVSNIGSTTYMNICTGKNVDVPWGMADYVAPPVFFILMLIIAWFAYKLLQRGS